MAGCICCIGFMLFLNSAQAREPRRFNASDMLDIVEVRDASVSLSANGKYFAFVYPDINDEYNVLSRQPSGYVHIVEISKKGTVAAKNRMRQLSTGADHTSFPAWSRSSREQRLAYFAEDRNGSRLELWNGETLDQTRISSVFSGKPYLAPQWDKTGNYVVFARVEKSDKRDNSRFLPPPTFAVAAQESNVKESFPRVIVLDSHDKRIPGDTVFIDNRKATLTVVDLSSGRESELTKEPIHLRDFKMSPGRPYVIFRAPTEDSFGLIGEEVLETFLVSLDGKQRPRSLSKGGEEFTWSSNGDMLFYLNKGDLYSMSLDGERKRAFASWEGSSEGASFSNFSWSPDGQWIAALIQDPSYEDSEIERPQTDMYTIARPAKVLYLINRLTNETHKVSFDSAAVISADDPVWSNDGKLVFFKGTNLHTYEDYIYRFELSTRRVTRLTEGKETIGRLGSKGNTFLFSAESANQSADFYTFDDKSRSQPKRRKVTTLNPQLSEFEFSVPDLIHYTNGDGETLGALLFRPVDVDPSRNIPVITYVYEKITPLRYHFSPRHQIFLNNGFAILMPNVKIKVGEPGTSFVKSVVSAAAAVRSMGFTNDKFAIWGGSFGAYATSYIITQTNMFSCAVSRATPPDLFRNWASGRDRDSRNIERGQARMGAGPYDVMERYFSQSAFFHLDKVETPILILHGAQDKTILFGEGEMFFYALRQLGKEAKFIAYTYGDHSLYRHSRADAIDVHSRLLDWFSNCLK